MAAFAGICYFAFSHWGMWLYFFIPLLTLVVNYGAITSFRMVFEEREKRKVRRTFERYVSPGVIRLIEQDPKKYFKTGGKYYYVQSLQFMQGGPDTDLGAVVFVPLPRSRKALRRTSWSTC